MRTARERRAGPSARCAWAILLSAAILATAKLLLQTIFRGDCNGSGRLRSEKNRDVAFDQHGRVTHVSLATHCPVDLSGKVDFSAQRNPGIAPMLRTILLATVALLTWNTQAEARLFLQTYGSTIPVHGSAADGCGNTWNWHQDYFVPRHASTCWYGLFSPCKRGQTYSPAALYCSQLYPGYCTAYNAYRYRWRNHVYRTHCGSTPLKPACGKWRSVKCRRGCEPRYASTRDECSGSASCEEVCGERVNCNRANPNCRPWIPEHAVSHCMEGFLPGVEPVGVEMLGSIPVDPADLLLTGALPRAPAAARAAIPGSLPLQLKTMLPSLGSPKSTNPTN